MTTTDPRASDGLLVARCTADLSRSAEWRAAHPAAQTLPARRQRIEYALEIACLLCSRLLGVALSPRLPFPPPVVFCRLPERTVQSLADWRRLRCWHCGGNVVAGDIQTRVISEPIDWSADRPRRGRPPKQRSPEPTGPGRAG